MSVLTYSDLIDAIQAVLPKIYYVASISTEKGFMFRVQPNMVCEHELWIVHPDDLPVFKKHIEDNGAVAIDQRAAWNKEQADFRKVMDENAAKFREQYGDLRQEEK